MITKIVKPVYKIFILVAVLSLILVPASAGIVGAVSPNLVPTDVGYIDHSYGSNVKGEPTADVAQSKLWFNDDFWWGILFHPESSTYRIYRMDWFTQNWIVTNTVMDSRKEVVGGVETGPVATRFDVLWDEGENKLYVASHIKIDNPSTVNDPANWARLYRYSYNTSNNSYSLDSGFPVTVNRDKTESLVLDKDSSGRLWVTYVTRTPSDPIGMYSVFVNFTLKAGDDLVWSGWPHKLADNVGIHDVSAIVRFGGNVGVMWSNGNDNNFYFASHTASNPDPTSGWTTKLVNPPTSLIANDHIKLVSNSKGQVFATVKTHNVVNTDPLLGVIARDTDGTFSFHEFSNVESNDSRPSLLYDDTENKLIMFVASNVSGGVICYKEMAVTSNLSSMKFPDGNCSSTAQIAPYFIASSQHTAIDNPTTSKRNVNENTGYVVLAADNTTGTYLHNFRGFPGFLELTEKIFLPVVTR